MKKGKITMSCTCGDITAFSLITKWNDQGRKPATWHILCANCGAEAKLKSGFGT